MLETWMREAIALSRNGYPAPNPHVGCVIVRDGQIVGRGFHHHAGGPHAEVGALREAGELAKGADVFVTLEPCNHTGRTPPCSRALIEAGVGRVWIANVDPNPVAAGGVKTLQDAGIEVFSGTLAEEASQANRQFLHAMRHRRPFVVVKSAITLDGRIAGADGHSKWITGPEAREAGHRLRAQCGAVLVGYKTVLQDDPELTARIPDVVNQPARIVLDPHRRLTGGERVFNDAAPTFHITKYPLQLESLLEELFIKSVRGLLVEGGAGVISRFVAARLVDRFEIFVAPKLLGAGLGWVDGLATASLDEATQLRFGAVQKLGDDLQITATFAK